MISSELRGYRDILRMRLRLVQKRISAKNSIHRILEKYNAQTPGELPPFAYLQLTLYEDQIALLSRQIKDLEQLLAGHLILDDDVQRLLWIPGVGKLGALTILLETDGMERSLRRGTTSPSVASFRGLPTRVASKSTSAPRKETATSRQPSATPPYEPFNIILRSKPSIRTRHAARTAGSRDRSWPRRSHASSTTFFTSRSTSTAPSKARRSLI
jgi:hypothetical protein